MNNVKYIIKWNHIIWNVSIKMKTRIWVFYVFCGSNGDDPRASSKGREGTEAIPFYDDLIMVLVRCNVWRKYREGSV